jgi:hypothetical protein
MQDKGWNGDELFEIEAGQSSLSMRLLALMLSSSGMSDLGLGSAWT